MPRALKSKIPEDLFSTRVIGEGPMHAAAKMAITNGLKNGAFEHLYISCHRDYGNVQYRLAMAGLSILTECTFPHIHAEMSFDSYKEKYGKAPLMIFDVALVNAQGEAVVAVEVSHKHWLDDKKRLKLLQHAIITVEIDHKVMDWHPERNRLAALSVLIPNRPKLPVDMWLRSAWRPI